jgi:hypothetical protein
MVGTAGLEPTVLGEDGDSVQASKSVATLSSRTFLQGQTPAEAAGIGVEAKDKWMLLLKPALEKKNEGIISR